MRKGPLAPAVVATFLAAGLLATGCGSDDEKAAKTITETETVTAEETTETSPPKTTAQPKWQRRRDAGGKVVAP